MKFELKTILLSLIIVGMLTPLTQFLFPFVEELELKGSYEVISEPDSLVDNWFSAKYQEEYTSFFNNNIGFRAFWVKTYNQLQFSFFHKTNAKDVVIGKDNFLFERGYIADYMGYSFIGKEKIKKKLLEIKQVKEILKKENIDFMLIFAPGKASYFPEYFPAEFDSSKRTISNYLCYVQTCHEIGLDFVDFNECFMQHKINNDDFPLYAKSGTHWSDYGITMAFDTICKRIEKSRKINMLDFAYDQIVLPDTIVDTDKEVSEAMNLLFEYEYYKMPTPKVIYDESNKYVKPKLLVVSDSYGFGLINSPMLHKLFDDPQFWYYNRLKNIGDNDYTLASEVDVIKEIRKSNVVILMASETNMASFDFDFSSNFLRQWHKKGSKYKEELAKIIKKLRENEGNFKFIQKQAKERGQTIEETLRRNAVYIHKNNMEI